MFLETLGLPKSNHKLQSIRKAKVGTIALSWILVETVLIIMLLCMRTAGAMAEKDGNPGFPTSLFLASLALIPTPT
jgi:hypothetical protein